MNKYKTYIVYVCHINTTSSKHLSDLIVKKIPKALELFVFFLTVFNTVSNLIYNVHAVLNHVLFYLVQQRKRKKWILPKTLIQHCFVTYTFLKRLR